MERFQKYGWLFQLTKWSHLPPDHICPPLPYPIEWSKLQWLYKELKVNSVQPFLGQKTFLFLIILIFLAVWENLCIIWKGQMWVWEESVIYWLHVFILIMFLYSGICWICQWWSAAAWRCNTQYKQSEYSGYWAFSGSEYVQVSKDIITQDIEHFQAQHMFK